MPKTRVKHSTILWAGRYLVENWRRYYRAGGSEQDDLATERGPFYTKPRRRASAQSRISQGEKARENVASKVSRSFVRTFHKITEI